MTADIVCAGPPRPRGAVLGWGGYDFIQDGPEPLAAPALRAWSDGRWLEDTFGVPSAFPVLVPSTSVAAIIVVPRNGTVRRMYVRLENAPGLGLAMTFTLMQNGGFTFLVATVNGAAVSGSNLSASVPVVAGDSLAVLVARTVNGSIPEAGTIRVEVEYV